VRQLPEGVLDAVIDGVGHGNEAADAARIAGRTLSSSPHEDTVSLVWRCHEALKETRGVVMTLLFLSPSGAMTWVGVGNIEAVIFRCDSTGRVRSNHVVLRGGVVGHRLPPLRAECLTMLPHDTVVLATDGIRPEFSDQFVPGEEPQAIADQIMARLGLVPAIEFLADGISQRWGIPVAVRGTVSGSLPLPVETALYRAAQSDQRRSARAGDARRGSAASVAASHHVHGARRRQGVRSDDGRAGQPRPGRTRPRRDPGTDGGIGRHAATGAAARAGYGVHLTR
jgi:hypothetical protein